ncbi:hypothetical protein BABINDRAFT_171760 [Babjeviella inositovora NRRL Y-12698]|uniref:tRNA-5-taurinomethyluridine 2-sulfurtransferase n=1 Tax=Babjeviella inositovora NRRL Y-12698 TaxID=984486 RepID=A0A1E3QPL3_9ASCO|nr:uncharacterized protein BABINDRAFT_171760 [Babjeviella inositovora NRRL Y-12698]ODQ79601.1 hypothetical protein BABINDRAFT_171760 [Babjeviella inositovora NRRL Y-12698]
MSSGVDSSVCAALYAAKYKNVKGVYMANWSQTAKCTEAEWNDVQRVCEKLRIPCERVNFEKEYWMDVFQPMVEMYERGLTPNPDVGCNRYVKFGKMIEHLTRTRTEHKNWWLATGHYARMLTHKESGEPHLLRGSYTNKDQSYYLSMLPKAAMGRLLFPIGHYTKPEVRELAKSFELPTAEKPDSVGLCFVSQDGSFRDFLNDYISPKPGNIITEDGTVHGRHNGIWHATIGQKSGISLPQGDPRYKGVWFVSAKRYKTNEIVIVKGGDNAALFSRMVVASDWNWVGEMSKEKMPPSGELSVQYRSLQAPCAVESFVVKDGTVECRFKEGARAIAPGQNLVLYHGERVLGAGLIVGATE